MSTAKPAMLWIIGRGAWTALWWVVAVGGCAILIASVLATLTF